VNTQPATASKAYEHWPGITSTNLDPTLRGGEFECLEAVKKDLMPPPSTHGVPKPNELLEESTFCGIAGYVGLNDEALLKRMIEVLRHRGPDDTGLYLDEGVGLANARLSIIDIEGGHQPIHNEDGTIHVTYNGEIYNFRELRGILESFGHRFYTQSDTEVIVHSYEQFGEDFASKLNGMFAIALWESRQKKLILARDRMGIKPLHYTINNNAIIFASEIKAILQADVTRAVNVDSLYNILNLGYIPGNGTLFRDIYKLPPSTCLTFQNGSFGVRSYWDIPTHFPLTDESGMIGEIQKALEESIRDQMVADVPVGCFLSGGLDTSTIVAYAQRATSQPLKTFCMGFGEQTDEFRDARLIAERFGTDHYELTVDSSQGIRLYPKMIWHMESPKYNLYPWFVCELVKKYVTVCLSGNGGDEVFGGYYTRYQNALRIQRLSKNALSPFLKITGGLLAALSKDMRNKNKFRALESLGDNTAEYLILAGVLPNSLNKTLFKDQLSSPAQLTEHYSQLFQGSDFLQGLMNAELRTKLVDDLLSVDDTMSMAHSLELRVPLLDNRIVDLMTVVPWQMKYTPGTCGKLLLRKAISGVLPEESLRKQKWGFSVNIQSWFKGEVGELVRQILPESEALGTYFRTDRVRKLIADTTSSERDRRKQVLLWQLLGFHFWHRIFIDSGRVGATALEVNAMVT
jgi:asparagine synthase (glutamine-hydrolysing)